MTSFVKKASIIIKHDYFGSGEVTGLSIKPTAECQRLLRNYKLLLKNTADGLDIYRDEDEKDAFTDKLPAATTVFDFSLALDDQQFLKYTALPIKKNDEFYLFSNKKGKTAFQLSTIPKVQTLNHGASEMLGILRLCFSFSAQTTLMLNFTAPQLKWKYYVLTGTAFPDPVIDGSATGITFIKQTALQATDQVGTALATGYPAAIISVFESDKAIPVINTGRKNIQLKKTAGNAVVINNLPNPGPGENGIQIINLLN